MIIYILVFCVGILAAFFAGAYVRKPFETGFFKGKKGGCDCEKRCCENGSSASASACEKGDCGAGGGDAVKEKQWSALLDYTVEKKVG